MNVDILHNMKNLSIIIETIIDMLIQIVLSETSEELKKFLDENFDKKTSDEIYKRLKTYASKNNIGR